MARLEQARLSRWVAHAAQAAAAVAIAVGIWVLVGWVFDVALLKSVFAGLVAMKANAALGFILAGISLWHVASPVPLPSFRILARVCAASVLLLGLITVAEYLSGADFHIDQLLLEDRTDLPGDIPGRMATTTAVCFAGLGAALLLLIQNDNAFVRAIHALAIGNILVAGAALVAYAYDLGAFLRVKLNYSPMAVNTAAVFVILSLGILNARPDYPLRRIITDAGAAGSASRLLLPAVIGFPFLSGWLVLRTIQMGYFSETVGLGLLAMANIAGFSALVLWNAARLHHVDAQRERAERALRYSARRYRDLVDNLQEGVWAIDKANRTTFVNPRMAEMLGYTVEEMRGRHLFAFMDEQAAEVAARHLARGHQGIKERFEFEFQRKDGTRIWTSLGASPLYDEEGRYAGALAGVMDITDRRQLEARLAESSAYTRRLIEVSVDPLVTISLEGKIMDVNEAMERATGLKREQSIGSDFSDYFTDPEAARAGYREVFAKGFVTDYPLALRHLSGKVMNVLYNARIYRDEQGRVAGVFAAARDITERRRMEAALKESERYIRRLLEELPAAVVVHRPDSVIRYGNATALKLLALTADQLVGKTATDPHWHFIRADGSVMPVEEYPANRVIAENKPVHDYLVGIVPAEGVEPRWVYVNAFPDFGRRGELREVIVSFVDITERKRAEEELRALQAQLREAAIRDPLTGLYNRRYMDETLARELARAAREQRPLSILMCDIDHFKRLNDTFGHQVGDERLRALAVVLHSHARTSDIPCRYGGEEFLVVLPEMPLEAARERAEQVRRVFAARCEAVGGVPLGSTVSIGVSAYPSHGTTVDELISAADQALYEAKQTGRNRVCVAGRPDG